MRLFVKSCPHADAIAAALSAQGWSLVPAFLSTDLVAALRADLLDRRAHFAPAAIGRAADRQQLPQTRSDSTLWLSGDSSAQSEFLALLDSVRGELNRRLFLGLIDYEAHYAHYAAGQFYRRHRDAFRESAASGLPQRIVSSVVYLNGDWRADAGGELRLWRERDEVARIAPLGGSAVFFLSAEIPHEVLPANTDRFSIAGWFRNRGR